MNGYLKRFVNANAKHLHLSRKWFMQSTNVDASVWVDVVNNKMMLLWVSNDIERMLNVIRVSFVVEDCKNML